MNRSITHTLYLTAYSKHILRLTHTAGCLLFRVALVADKISCDPIKLCRLSHKMHFTSSMFKCILYSYKYSKFFISLLYGCRNFWVKFYTVCTYSSPYVRVSLPSALKFLKKKYFNNKNLGPVKKLL